MNFLLVLREMVSQKESLATDITGRSFTSVLSHVRFQVVALPIFLGTFRTLEGLLFSVHAHMNLQVIGSVESLPADVAEMRLLVLVVPFVYV